MILQCLFEFYQVQMSRRIIDGNKQQMRTTISSNLVLIMLLIGAVSGQQSASAAVESNYCEMVSLTTPELALDIEQNPTQQSNYQIKLTEQYQVSNVTLALGYIQSQQDLMLQVTTPDLVSTLYTENVSNDLVFIDAKNGYMLAIEIIDQINNFYDYVVLKANLDPFNSENMLSKLTLIPEMPTGSSNNTKESLIISRIISMDSSWMYFLVKDGQVQQSLYKLKLADLQTGNSSVQLLFVANINEENKSVNIIGGNIYHLYDRNTMQFYQLQTDPATQQLSYKPIMLSQLNLDSIMNLNTLNFVSLSNHYVLMYSYLNTQTIIIPITQKTIQSSQAIIMSGSPTLYTDNWMNCLIVTEYDFFWVKSQIGSTQWNYQQFSTTIPLQQRDQLQAIMSNAQYISFDRSYAMVVSKNVGNQQGSLSSVLYDPVNAPYFTIVDSLRNSIDLSQLQFSNSTASGMSTYQSSFKCNCVGLQVDRLECYAGPLKCMTITKPIRTDCTKTL